MEAQVDPTSIRKVGGEASAVEPQDAVEVWLSRFETRKCTAPHVPAVPERPQRGVWWKPKWWMRPLSAMWTPGLRQSTHPQLQSEGTVPFASNEAAVDLQERGAVPVLLRGRPSRRRWRWPPIRKKRDSHRRRLHRWLSLVRNRRSWMLPFTRSRRRTRRRTRRHTRRQPRRNWTC